jgi:diguanylate cyclase (GGDEF)-like protein
VILVAAVAQAEITRHLHAGRQEPRTATAMTAAWALAAGVGVHLTLAIALTLVLYTYHSLRGKHELFHTFAGHAGLTACAVVAAHFAASFGAWATWSPRADTVGVLALAAAVAAYLVVIRAPGVRDVSPRHLADLGLDAALLATGAVAGALATGGPLVVLAAIPVVVMLHNAALTERLEDEAAVDQKTGLATVASWQEHADRAFAEAAPDRRPIGVLMVDLDHFKRLNDSYGHCAGDDFLAAVGECLRSQLRHTDLAGRFGGEEFTVLLPGADVIDTMAAAERIRAAISTLRVTTADNHGRPVVITGVTASVGAAVHPHHGATAHDCLRVADSHVYQAKQQGRNTVVVGIATENLAPLRARPPGRSA